MLAKRERLAEDGHVARKVADDGESRRAQNQDAPIVRPHRRESCRKVRAATSVPRVRGDLGADEDREREVLHRGGVVRAVARRALKAFHGGRELAGDEGA